MNRTHSFQDQHRLQSKSTNQTETNKDTSFHKVDSNITPTSTNLIAVQRVKDQCHSQKIIEMVASDEEHKCEKEKSYHSSDSDEYYDDQWAVNRRTSFRGIGDEDNGETIDIDRWYEWNYTDILNWIMSLEHGLFIQYQGVLSQILQEEDVKGDTLENVKEIDMERWGITKKQNQQLLLRKIKRLTDSKDRNQTV